MKIRIKREGGFIGITSKANLEFDELTPDEQRTFNSLAQQSLESTKPKWDTQHKTDMPSEMNPRGMETNNPILNQEGLELAGPQMPRNNYNNMRDAFSYSVSMRKDGKTVSMKFDDMNAPPEIVEIFQKYVQY